MVINIPNDYLDGSHSLEQFFEAYAKTSHRFITEYGQYHLGGCVCVRARVRAIADKKKKYVLCGRLFYHIVASYEKFPNKFHFVSKISTYQISLHDHRFRSTWNLICTIFHLLQFFPITRSILPQHLRKKCYCIFIVSCWIFFLLKNHVFNEEINI